MATLFTKIIKGEIPSYKIAETTEFYAFLDIHPNAIGHTLCIPKKEVDKIFDLDDETYVGLMQFSKRVAKALAKTVDCKRVGMSVIGLEVPHVHVHLIPLTSMQDVTFQSKVKMEKKQFEELALQVSKNFS